jgi:hypothetical protein
MFRYCQSFPSSEKCGPFRSSAGILEEVEAVNDRYMRGSLAPWKTGMLPVTGLKEGDGTAGAAGSGCATNQFARCISFEWPGE